MRTLPTLVLGFSLVLSSCDRPDSAGAVRSATGNALKPDLSSTQSLQLTEWYRGTGSGDQTAGEWYQGSYPVEQTFPEVQPTVASTASPIASPVAFPISRDAADVAACEKYLQKPVARVVVTGETQSLVLDNALPTVVKVVGNHPDVEVNVNFPNHEGKAPGLCIFAAGNQSAVHVNLGADVNGLFLRTRGNQAQIDVKVAENLDVSGRMRVELAGNQNDVSIAGVSGDVCAKLEVDEKGHTSSIECIANIEK